MRAIDAIRTVLKFSDMGMKYLADMSDAPLLRPGPWGGNHAMWIAGHLTVVEGRLQQMLHGTENPVARWKALFDWGSEPVDDLAAYPPFEEVLRTFKELRARTHAFLDEVGEAGLDRPTKSQPPGFGGAGFETVGGAIVIIAGHATGHLGQLNVVRAAAGKGRLFVPSEALRAY
ncbi:MAG TPA: DinB family protein [Tepidisphaeraceae bacterium]|nr:DinB family protein [Tepidisphaeraceae bacterium]